MPKRFLSTFDFHAVGFLNLRGYRRRWRWPARAMAWMGTLEGSLLSWGLLALLDPRLAFPLLFSGFLGLLLFKAGKRYWRRSRPFVRYDHIVAHAAPPDVFSFPSGHAMHAGSLAVIVALAWPWAWPLALGWFAIMGASRLILGLHYPSDVLAGGVIGALLGALSWQLALLYSW